MPKDNTFYFSHDYNVRTDNKIKKLLAKHKMEGYGIFWAIVEDLYNNANALPLDYESIAFDLRVDENLVESVINNFDLFTISGNIFSSQSISKRLGERISKSKKASDSAKARWSKKNANALPPHTERIPNAMQTQSDSNAIKESKVKESKVNSFNTPTIEKVKEVFFQNRIIGATKKSSDSFAEKFYNHYESNGWKINGQEMANWEARVKLWIADPKNNNQVEISAEHQITKQKTRAEIEKEMEEWANS